MTGLVVAVLGLVATHAGMAMAQSSVLDPKGPIMRAERTILADSMVIMLAIIIPTIVGTLVFAWWFRASNKKAHYRPNWAFSGQLELVTWGGPLLTIMLLGGVIWVSSHDLDPYKPIKSARKALEVQVVALDWKWLFIYPDQRVASVNELVVPAATPIHFTLTSASVLTTFFVPELGSMIYVMNGMADQLNLEADKPGTFWGQASHFNGDGFSAMHFYVHSVPDDQFAQWIATTRQTGPVLDRVAYQTLSRQTIGVVPFTYSNADPNLFAEVVSQVIPPASGPTVGLPSADISPRTPEK